MNQIWIDILVYTCHLRTGAELCRFGKPGNGTGDWLQRRALDLRRGERAHPHADAEIARLKAKTASEVKAYLASATPAETSAGASPVIWRVKGGHYRNYRL